MFQQMKFTPMFFGPRNVGKTYYMLKMLEQIGNRRTVYIITRSPNQYPQFETSKESKPIKKTRGQLNFLMLRWKLETVLKQKNSTQEVGMKV